MAIGVKMGGYGFGMAMAEIMASGVQPLKSEIGQNTVPAILVGKELKDITYRSPFEEALPEISEILTEYITSDLRTDELDLPYIMMDRFNGCIDYLRSNCKDEEQVQKAYESLRDSLIAHYENAKKTLSSDPPYVVITPASQVLGDPKYAEDGNIHLKIPSGVAKRALAWNGYIISQLKSGKNAQAALESIFSQDAHPKSEALKLGDGTWIHLYGHVMFEVGQFGGRLLTREHDKKQIGEKVLIPDADSSTELDMSEWFGTTHFMDVKTTELAIEEGIVEPESVNHLSPNSVLQAYKEILEIMRLNPGLFNRVLSESWLYDPALSNLFPEQSISGINRVVGDSYCLRDTKEDSNDVMFKYAILTSRTRRRAYNQGIYQPKVYSAVINEKQMKNLVND